jgi:hypothetical protein
MDPSESNGKRCSGCGEFKPLTEYHLSRNKKDGRQAYCKECNNLAAKQFHAMNAEHCRARIKKRSDRIREDNRWRLVAYLLKHPCVDCGETDPVVLDFDHLRDKRMNVSALVNQPAPWNVILAEIRKCEVVCANCHRRRTCERVGGYRIRITAELREQSA